TPLEQGVTRGQEALAGQTFTDPVTVVILTDGAPNCNTNQQNVIDQIQAWHDKGIITHVVGLPGAGGAAQLLDQLAMTGGSASYIDPADPTVLQNELAKVFTSTIKVGLDSCTIHLDQKPEAPEKLHLVVKQNGMEQDVPRMLSKTAGWNLNSAADTVTLTGQLCDLAKSGTFEELRFEYGCVDLPPLPPPPVPQ
ncbi:MAG TPA: hypothetical protein VHM19_11255, partial [Polyangiales bacterium]|nr:hypothetical protein [Polyangiales bacterium]